MIYYYLTSYRESKLIKEIKKKENDGYKKHNQRSLNYNTLFC